VLHIRVSHQVRRLSRRYLSIAALKEAIKEKKPAFDHVSADTLKLWAVGASYQDKLTPMGADVGNVPLAGQCQVQL
jgi:hypothetical protein